MTGVMCAPCATMGAVGTSLPAARGRVAGRKVPAGAKGGAVVRGRRSSRGVRVRAAGGGLFGAASAVNTQEIAAKITEIKETELELSRGIWRAVDAATAAATDAVAPLAGMDLTRGLRAAFDGALQAVPEPIRERVSALIDMVMANEELVRTVSSVPDIVWVLAIVATVGSKALGRGSSATAGMDEWAALAAAEGDEEPIQLQNYDPDAIYAHFKKRPLVLLKRGIRSGSLLGGFGFSLWLDRKMLGEDPPEKKKAAVDAKRAIQLRDLLISLGPTYVKLGQVLSSRQDLLPAPYIKELRTLQDSVPPFDDNLAKRILAAELGPAGARNLSLGDAPIASASLGQVYRGTLKKPDGTTEEVAVKVQRPGALVAISLDVGIIRSFAEPWRKFKGLNTDLESLVDEWGIRFINELDYGQEAAAGEQFRLAMESRPDLAGVVTTAPVMPSASTRRVLTTGWINGQRLDTSEEGDVPRLCAVALASYLAMLLDIGTLHADPHPGNLFRTDDGKLCILDWGLVTPVSKDLRTAILSFIAHLVSKDFEAVPGDLDAMGFIPTGKREAMEDLGVASAIGLLFSALAKGGGAEGFRAELGLPDEDQIKEIRKELKGVKDMKVRREKFLEASGGADSKVAQLTRDLEGIQEKYGNIFQIPSYFGYILRSFSVLEGIGLASDKNYSIANECYPYVARRLLTDDTPETRRALEQLLYGKNGPKAQLSVKRVKQLANAFGNYSSITNVRESPSPVDGDEPASAGLSQGTKEALRLAFAPEGSPAQDILLRELARFPGAAASNAVNSVASAPALGFLVGLAEAQQRAAEALGPARPPVPTAIELFAPLTAAARQTEADRETLRVAEELQELVRSLAPQSSASSEASSSSWVDVPLLGEVPMPSAPSLPMDERMLRELLELAPELAPGAQAAALRFGSVLLDQAAERVADAEKEDQELRSRV